MKFLAIYGIYPGTPPSEWTWMPHGLLFTSGILNCIITWIACPIQSKQKQLNSSRAKLFFDLNKARYCTSTRTSQLRADLRGYGKHLEAGFSEVKADRYQYHTVS